MQAYNVSPKLYDSYEPNDKRRAVILDEYWVNNQGTVTGKVTKKIWVSDGVDILFISTPLKLIRLSRVTIFHWLVGLMYC